MRLANLCLIVLITVVLSACAGKKPKKGGGGGGGGPKGNPPAAGNKNPGNPNDPAAALRDDGEDEAPGLKERIEDELAARNNGDFAEIIDETGLPPDSSALPFPSDDDLITHNSDENPDLFGPVNPEGEVPLDPSLNPAVDPAFDPAASNLPFDALERRTVSTHSAR